MKKLIYICILVLCTPFCAQAAYTYGGFSSGTSGGLDDGTATGQLLWWDGLEWTYLETSEIFWNDTDKRFGINTSTPRTVLDILSTTEGIRHSYTDNSVYSGWITNSSGVAQMTATGNSFTFPSGTAVNPGIAFGDGDTGFYESVDDNMVFARSGAGVFSFGGQGFSSLSANGAALFIRAASATVPTLMPNRGDPDTGIGAVTTGDKLSLVAGGVEGILITETGAIIVEISGKTTITDTTGPQVEFIYDGLNKTTGETDSNGDFTLTPTGDKITVGGFVLQDGIFGEIHVADNSTSQSIPTGVTYTKLTAFDENGGSANVTPDQANDKITITIPGWYRVSGKLSFISGTANVVWYCAAFLNGSEQHQAHFVRKAASLDVGDANFNGFIDVSTVPWDVDVRVRHDNIGTVGITPVYMNLNIEYMGET